MQQAKGMVGSAMSSIERSVSAAKSALGALGIGLGVGYFVHLVRGAIDAQDELAKLSQKLGISVSELAGLRHAAELAGVSHEGLQKGVKTLATQMFDASMGLAESRRNFAALGIEVKNTDGTLKASDAVLVEVAEKFSKFRDGAEKSALAVKLFGKAGLDMIPLLNQGGAELANLIAEGKRLNPVTEESARQSELFNDSMKRLGGSISSVVIRALNELMPALSRTAQLFSNAALSADGFWKSAAGWALTSGAETDAPWAAIDKTTEALARQRKLLGELQGSWASWFNADDIAILKNAIAMNEAKLSYLKGLRSTMGMVGDTGMPTDRTPGPPPKLVDEAALKRAADEKARLLKLDADGWVKYIEARNQEWEAELLAEAALAKQFWENEERLRQADIAGWVAHAEAVFAAADAENLALARIAEEANRANDIGRDLGLTFSSAFEDMIVKGGKVSDMFRALEQDIIRIVTRRLVTDPLADAITKGVQSSDIFKSMGSWIGSIFGGGKAGGGDVWAGVPYLVGERGPEIVVPRQSGTVIPNGGIRPLTVVNHFNISGTVDRATREQIAADASRALARAQRHL